MKFSSEGVEPDITNNFPCHDSVMHELNEAMESLNRFIVGMFYMNDDELINEDSGEKLYRSDIVKAHKKLMQAVYLCQFKYIPIKGICHLCDGSGVIEDLIED